jgi:hypothetical protein
MALGQQFSIVARCYSLLFAVAGRCFSLLLAALVAKKARVCAVQARRPAVFSLQ